jgi:histidyl-tRNA synthetase
MASSQQAIDYWVAPTESAAYVDAVRVATRLREAGASAEYPLREQALAKQLKAASGVGAAHVLFVAPTIATTGELEVKSLADGSQQRTTLDVVLERARQSHQGSTDRP